MVKMYYMPLSPPSRSVMMVARALGIELDLEKVDLFRGEHKTPEFKEINLTQTIPVIDDDGFILSESRAIMCYLADKYSTEENDSLYPKDPQQRAIVNQRLYFDTCTFFPRFSNYYYPNIWIGGEPNAPKLAPLEEAMMFLDKFLEATPWVAGDHLTIADMSLITNVNGCQVLGFDMSQYPNVTRWLEDARSTIQDYDEIEQVGLTLYKEAVDAASAPAGED